MHIKAIKPVSKIFRQQPFSSFKMTNTSVHKEEDIVIDYEAVDYRQETAEFFHNLPHYIQEYIISLFPIASWIHRYNVAWLIRDLIAGITVGVVVVPQSMGYAKIAQLPPQYGL
jgi:sodium-independent sulfate anion transporter 11